MVMAAGPDMVAMELSETPRPGECFPAWAWMGGGMIIQRELYNTGGRFAVLSARTFMVRSVVW